MKRLKLYTALCARHLYLFGALTLLASPLAGQPAARLELSQPDARFGEEVTATLTLSGQAGTFAQPDFSAWEAIENLEILQTRQAEKAGENGLSILTIQHGLIFWDSGYYELPPVPIPYNQGQDTAYSNSPGIQIMGFPVESDSVRLMPIKAIIDEPLTLRDYLPFAVGGLLLSAFVLVGYWLWKNKRPDAKPPAPPRRLALREYLLEQLDELEQKGLWQQGQTKAYHSELTSHARSYLAYRYQIPARELTTTEILDRLKGAHLPEGGLQTVQQLLQTADLVKFAKAAPPEQFHAEALQRLRRFAAATAGQPELMIAIYADGRKEVYEPQTEEGTTDTSNA